MGNSADQLSSRPQTHICKICKGLNLSIADFFDTARSEIRLDSWGSFRKASLGTLADILGRPGCPLCSLASRVIGLKSQPRNNAGSPIEYEACLRWEDPIWDKEVMKVRRPVFLGFRSDLDQFDLHFVPSLRNAAYGGFSTIQYSARHLQTLADKGGLVRQWLDTCIREHGPACGDAQSFSPCHAIPHLIFIDVHEYCLVDAPLACTYTALSYVWGREPFFNLTKCNISWLRRPGSLKEHAKLLPKTISDAIHFVRHIGERYLWIDSLCIVQDDKDQKHGLIDSMDVIFSSALLTIIAATGRDANAGIFGEVLPAERIVDGLDLTGIDFFKSRHNNRKWFHETRGWTYQEQLLSRRHVVFADGLAFFVCSTSVWREDLVTEETDLLAGEGEINKHFQRPLMPRTDPAAAISAYISCVHAYSCRDLSYAEDGLNAFAGISKILEAHLESVLLYGLPIKYFELALLWAPRGKNLTRRESFPSWSWAGWSGGVDISPVHRATDRVHRVKMIKDDYEYYEPSLDEFFLMKSFHERTHVRAANRNTLATNVLTQSKHRLYFNKPGIIRFEGQCATFNIALFEPTPGKKDRSNLGILDAHDNLIGELEDGHEFLLESLPNLLGLHEVVVISEKLSESWHYSLFPNANIVVIPSPIWPHGRVAVSIYSPEARPYLPKSEASASNSLPSNGSGLPQVRSVRSRLDLKMHKASDWNLFNVMVLEWRDGIAYRLGIGWIFKESLAKSFEPGQRTKTIVLG